MITRAFIGFICILAIALIADLFDTIEKSRFPDTSFTELFLFWVFCTTVGTLGAGMVIWAALFNVIGLLVQRAYWRVRPEQEPVVPSWIKRDSGEGLIVKYLRDRLALGHESTEMVSAHLHEMGWDKAAIEQANKEVESKPVEARVKSNKRDHKRKPKRHTH